MPFANHQSPDKGRKQHDSIVMILLKKNFSKVALIPKLIQTT